jgi:hypothetical protein
VIGHIYTRGVLVLSLGGWVAHDQASWLVPAYPAGIRCHVRSIRDLKRRAVLRTRAAVIVDPRRGNIRVPEPFLHLRNVGLMVEGVDGSRRTQRVCADLETQLRRIGRHQLVNPVRGDRVFKLVGSAVVADRPEQRTVFIPCPAISR